MVPVNRIRRKHNSAIGNSGLLRRQKCQGFRDGRLRLFRAAVAKDEGRDHQGPSAIRTWIEETATKYDDRAEVRAVSSSGDTVEVTANVTGKFPGSPILLRFKFTLDDGQISRLEIAP